MKSFTSNLLLSTIVAAACVFSFVGCGGSGDLKAVTDDADAAAIAEYDRLDAESEEAANAEESEGDDGDE